VKRLSLGSSVASVIAAALSGPKLETMPAFQPAIVDPIRFHRCYCRVCREADAREQWGAWQYQML
jgi:hypothetical protein